MLSKFSFKHLLIHLLFWMLYVALEYAANYIHLHGESGLRFIRETILSLPILMIPTYFLVFVAVPRWLARNKTPLFLLSLIGIGVFVVYARVEWRSLTIYIEEGEYFNVPPAKLLKNIIRDYSMIALASCIYIISDWKRKQRVNEQLLKAKAEAEISILKSQLNPHFLFNSLNNIYSLALSKSDKAPQSILMLTKILDYLVYWIDKKRVSIKKEIELLDSYISLEKLRHGEYLEVELAIDIRNELEITPLIVLPFIENSFKHGGKNKNGEFKVRLELLVEGGNFELKISNTKPHLPNTNEHGGIGLNNIKHRLKLLYPKHHLNIRDVQDVYEIELKIPNVNAQV